MTGRLSPAPRTQAYRHATTELLSDSLEICKIENTKNISTIPLVQLDGDRRLCVGQHELECRGQRRRGELAIPLCEAYYPSRPRRT
jgi:hypothetical protein